ncbi:hypothetical protein NFJ01_09750 [Lelliottia amnigena]|uniref:hypothetical protein n=1 Tax=Lelliottia amnigena TaxID=61646 RepID=UPI00209198FF|nr:hypothetical protein [Lelliottia amnigena]USR62619.1 hypothetical protein NFJ01_09750 [Lelliottia amnigena]
MGKSFITSGRIKYCHRPVMRQVNNAQRAILSAGNNSITAAMIIIAINMLKVRIKA